VEAGLRTCGEWTTSRFGEWSDRPGEWRVIKGDRTRDRLPREVGVAALGAARPGAGARPHAHRRRARRAFPLL